MLSMRTVQHAIANRRVGLSPLVKGKSAEISREWVELVGEADVAEIKATMQASVIGTDNEAKYNNAYCWDLVRRKHADILVPTKRRRTDEIRWNWLVFDNVDQFLMI